jgi:regulator of CtrA degradation
LALLPSALRDLIARSQQLQSQVRRLDATIHAPADTVQAAAVPNAVSRQWGMLKAAFGSDAR